MKIQKKRLVLPELEAIERLSEENTSIIIDEKEVDFPFELFPMICRHTDLGRRPWLFDLTDDVIFASITCNVNDEVLLYVQHNEFRFDHIEQEINLTAEQAKDLIAHCVQGIDIDKHGNLEIEKVTGRDRDGAEETEMINISLYDLLDSDLIGYNEALTIYAYYLNLKTQERRPSQKRFPWEIQIAEAV